MNYKQNRRKIAVLDELQIGALLAGTYRILSVVGQGGIGIVYRANHLLLNRTVAVKVLHPDHIKSRKVLLRFQREAVLAASLSHPGIVTVYDFGVNGQVPYLVMDYLDGKTLSDAFKHERIHMISFFDIFSQACRALNYAHERGIIHRDLNCNNLMLVNTGEKHKQLKIIDFGLAKAFRAAEQQSQELTGSGVVAGCPYFMSPEQIRGVEADIRSDIYSLGCVMYRCLTGFYPIEGSSSMDTMCKHLTDQPRPMSKRIGTILVPPHVERLVMSCLEKSPDRRPQSMAEIAHYLEQLRVQSFGHTDIISPNFDSVPVVGRNLTCHM